MRHPRFVPERLLSLIPGFGEAAHRIMLGLVRCWVEHVRVSQAPVARAGGCAGTKSWCGRITELSRSAGAWR